MTALPGIDLDRVSRWLDEHQPGLRQGTLAGELMVGGKSNLTFRITDGTAAWVLRRPPLGHVLATAHDMSREFTIISCLRATAVPVPPAIALCPDPAVLGAPFYLMGFVDGRVADSLAVLRELSPNRARKISETLVDTLAALHGLAPRELGLGAFGRPAGYLNRQVSRWRKQWSASQTRPVAMIWPLADRLAASIPPSSEAAIVHGDYRLANTILTSELDGIAAVIDWEMATLGDPLADISLLMAYQELASAGFSGLMPQPPSAGFLSPQQLADRYQRRARRDISRLSWYMAFSYFKLAVIFETIRRRNLNGQAVGSGVETGHDYVPDLIQAAWRSLSDE